MKVWRPGITGKLFLAIFATCIVLLISMHWAVRVSFERGFIDYIKHGNEQRLQMLGDALGDQYQQHGNWRFYATTIASFSRFCVHLSMTTTAINPAPVCRRTVGAPNSGSSIKMAGCWSAHAVRCRMTVLVGPFWSMAPKSARLSPLLSSG